MERCNMEWLCTRGEEVELFGGTNSGCDCFIMQVVSMTMAGHLGQLSLSSVATATSFTKVTAFIPLLGLAPALETLFGQANGAELS
ncbi:hypothetical protein Pint_18697 [Pistacia integerrima]|uniref:Uncharacterized protein n=1 Tax=Pistacia integerrima TaxID=434235 RepID=A0ACC0YWG5_9ROSI|nr:hypothetical protein Pint_18697 [Pistacia integerrima]